MIGKLSVGSVNIEVTQQISPESRSLIAQRLQEFNAPYPGNHPFGNLDVYVRDADGQVVGGLIREFAFGWLSIRVLWIAERLRGTGIGSTILKAAEDTAIENGCHSASLDTMNFQAPAFYEKRGYVRIGVADGYPGGAQKIHEKGTRKVGLTAPTDAISEVGTVAEKTSRSTPDAWRPRMLPHARTKLGSIHIQDHGRAAYDRRST